MMAALNLTMEVHHNSSPMQQSQQSLMEVRRFVSIASVYKNSIMSLAKVAIFHLALNWSRRPPQRSW